MKISDQLLIEIQTNAFTSDELHIDGPEIHYEDMIKLIDAIRLNRYIKKFVLMEIESIDSKSFTLLASLTNLEEIIAMDSCVTDVVARELLSSKVKALYLDANSLTDACLDGIENNKTLIKLSLSGNQLTDKGIKMISKNETIKNLFLSQCGIDDSCTAFLADMRSLEKLNLSLNNITDVGFKVLYDSNIREIDLGGNWNENCVEKITTERLQRRNHAQHAQSASLTPAFEINKKTKRKEEKEEVEAPLKQTDIRKYMPTKKPKPSYSP